MSKTVTFNAIVLADVLGLSLGRTSTGGWSCTASARVHDTANSSQYGASFTIPVLSPAQNAAIDTFVTNNVVAQLNTQEGV